MYRKLAAFLLATAFLPAISFSQFRKYSNEFLNIGAGARGLAMGSAQIASVNDATAGYWTRPGSQGLRTTPIST